MLMLMQMKISRDFSKLVWTNVLPGINVYSRKYLLPFIIVNLLEQSQN